VKIQGTVALVTGANRGIGRAFVDELLARGASKVYAGARDSASVQVADPRIVAIALDVADPERVAAVAEQLSDVALVVNNAGVGSAAFALQASLDDARYELEVNYLGVVSMTTAFAPVLASNGGGAFVNMLSVVSFVGTPLLSTYSASKAAAWNYTNAARIQLTAQGTEVLGVHVGFVDTDLTSSLDVEKIAPAKVAQAAFDALEAGQSEALVDDFSRAIKQGLSDDQSAIYPQVAKDFAALTTTS
jgi:NAD(P)-dependent dehydrogenase (short-subunit alcohol dehydrogenase family)